METTRIELKLFLFAFAGIFAVEFLAALAAASLPAQPLELTGAVRLLETALMIGGIQITGPGLSALGLSRRGIAAGISKGLLWSAGFGLLTALAGLGLLIAGIDPLHLVRTPIPQQAGALLLLFLVGGIVGPVAEELFFRGIVYGFFRRWGILPALVLSTLPFVLLHDSRGISAYQLPQLIGGVVFAAAYECEGNLVVPITIHVLGNLALFTISGLL
jgi:hypothetical protein